jgi:Cu+-exporting ATPase
MSSNIQASKANDAAAVAGRGAQGPTDQIYTCPMHPEVSLRRFGSCPKCGMALEPAFPETASHHDAEYVCPMHPDQVRSQPGSCQICGMSLELSPGSGMAADDRHPELDDITRRFKVSLPIAVLLLALAMSDVIPGQPVQRVISAEILNYIQLALAAPVVLWGGWTFFQRGWASIINRSLNMFTLISVGTGTAFWFSVVATLFPSLFPGSFRNRMGEVDLYFEVAASITVLVQLGQVLELRARTRTGKAVTALLGLQPKTATLIGPDGVEREALLRDIERGDHLRVRPGDKVPVDGRVIQGVSYIDESMVTGESVPVEKTSGNQVTAGTINGNGSFIMVAERVGSETLLAQIVRMVGAAQRSRAPIQRLADVVASYFVPLVVAAAILTFIVWGLIGPQPRLAHALVNAIAVVIIACPCALGLATPISIVVGVGRGAAAGLLIRNAEALEALEKVDTLVVDKTGTLTQGAPALSSVIALANWTESELLRLAASVELASEHPIARAIVTAAQARSLELYDVEGFQSVPGAGVTGQIAGRKISAGNSKYIQDTKRPSAEMKASIQKLRENGQTVIVVLVDDTPAGFLGVSDPIKPSTPEAIQRLHEDGIRIVMLSGDNRATAEAVARHLGIDEVEADVSPEQKVQVVRKLQAAGSIVAMAGDGINDAPALALANVGIAMGTGTDVAIESAAVTLLKGDLLGIARARSLSRATMRNIRQNLFFAFAYNALGIPIAAGILYPVFGLLLSPIIASAAMSLSSVSVIANALRLRAIEL